MIRQERSVAPLEQESGLVGDYLRELDGLPDQEYDIQREAASDHSLLQTWEQLRATTAGLADAREKKGELDHQTRSDLRVAEALVIGQRQRIGLRGTGTNPDAEVYRHHSDRLTDLSTRLNAINSNRGILNAHTETASALRRIATRPRTGNP